MAAARSPRRWRAGKGAAGTCGGLSAPREDPINWCVGSRVSSKARPCLVVRFLPPRVSPAASPALGGLGARVAFPGAGARALLWPACAFGELRQPSPGLGEKEAELGEVAVGRGVLGDEGEAGEVGDTGTGQDGPGAEPGVPAAQSCGCCCQTPCS